MSEYVPAAELSREEREKRRELWAACQRRKRRRDREPADPNGTKVKMLEAFRAERVARDAASRELVKFWLLKYLQELVDGDNPESIKLQALKFASEIQGLAPPSRRKRVSAYIQGRDQ